jgi:hypothetical protein
VCCCYIHVCIVPLCVFGTAQVPPAEHNGLARPVIRAPLLPCRFRPLRFALAGISIEPPFERPGRQLHQARPCQTLRPRPCPGLGAVAGSGLWVGVPFHQRPPEPLCLSTDDPQSPRDPPPSGGEVVHWRQPILWEAWEVTRWRI